MSDEFQSGLEKIEDSYRIGIRAFAEWFAESWKISREEWERDYVEKAPSEEWFSGHNAGVEGVLMAADAFLDEQMNR